jgi:putative ABC transport system permease protein
MIRQFLLSLRITWQNFSAAKLRTSLTVLGIVIGIGAILVVMSIGASAQDLILAQIRAVGSNLIGILPGAAEKDGPPASAFGIVITTLTNDDLDAIKEQSNVPHAVAVSGYVTGNAVVKNKNYSKSQTFQGVSADMINVENNTIAVGRFFSVVEDEKNAPVAVLGSTIAKDIFDNADPLGKKIKIDDQSFRVIGVLEPKGSSLISNFDEMIYVPLHVAQKNLLGIDHLNFIRLRVDSEEYMTQTEQDVDTLLRSRHDIPDDEDGDFSIRNMASALSIINNVTNIMKYFLAAVAAVSLVVGGIGVMNIMFIALSQRIREIGLRKAVGARKRDIVMQFLFESMTIASVGGIMGFLCGVGVVYLVGYIARAQGYTWTVFLSWDMVVMALVTSTILGFFFGIYPAWKASKISPMEALRYE